MTFKKLKKQIFENHKNFESRLDSAIEYGIDIIKDKLQLNKLPLFKQEKSMLLEALLLRSCALWESFIDSDIIFLVALEPTKIKEEMALDKWTRVDLKLIRALIFSGTYRTFRDIAQSMGILKKLLSDKYNLFQEITSEQNNKTLFVYKMRNYLSHYSSFSRKQLFTAYKNIYGYKRFIEPGVFLMKKEGKNFEELIHNFKMMSILMRKKLQ